MKVWNPNKIYNVAEEFNRIENFNEYCKKWFSYYNITVSFTSKINWTISDIPDINDFNRIKRNINILLNTIDSQSNRLSISTQLNQSFTVSKANEIEQRLNESLKLLGEWQFSQQITGLTYSGNNLKIGGVN